MKIRNGFVSNSSSSSFILRLDSVPTSPEELKEMIFGKDAPEFVNHWGDEIFSTDRLCDIVYSDITDSLNDSEDIFENVSIHEYNVDDFEKLVKEEFLDEFKTLKREMKKHEKSSNFWDIKDTNMGVEAIRTRYEKLGEFGEKLQNIVKESLKDVNYTLCKIEYSDNDGDTMSFIEHGDFLDPITLIKINNH